MHAFMLLVGYIHMTEDIYPCPPLCYVTEGNMAGFKCEVVGVIVKVHIVSAQGMSYMYTVHVIWAVMYVIIHVLYTCIVSKALNACELLTSGSEVVHVCNMYLKLHGGLCR